MSDKKPEVERDMVRYVFSCRGYCFDGEFQLFANKYVATLYCPYCGKPGNFSQVRKFEFEEDGNGKDVV